MERRSWTPASTRPCIPTIGATDLEHELEVSVGLSDAPAALIGLLSDASSPTSSWRFLESLVPW